MKKKTPITDPKALAFVDLSSELDRRFYLLAELCTGVSDAEAVDAGTFNLLGDQLKELLAKRTVLEHHFWGREIGVFPIDDATVEAEQTYLKLRTE